MGKRVVFGTVLILLAVGLFWLDWRLAQAGWPVAAGRPLVGLPLTAAVAALAAIGFFELAGLTRRAGAPLLPVTGLLATLALVLSPAWLQPLGGRSLVAVPLLASWSLLAVFLEQLARHRVEGAVRHVSATTLAILYLGVGGAVVLSIRTHFGLGAFILFMVVVKACDIGAYFTGSLWGRHKMIPWLSPGKSWEGLVGGTLLGVAAGIVFTQSGLALDEPGRMVFRGQPVLAAAFAAVMAIFGQVGDLCESALKRDAGMKDSGQVVPGFGGVLDILDSPLLSAPAAYLLLASLA